MRRLGTFVVLFALAASPLYAQGRGRYDNSSQGIPPGQMPPAGMCRVWYDGVPPGRQPRATNCNDAERIASRTNNARVIYGSDAYGNNSRVYGNTYPNTYPAYPNRGYGNNGSYGTNGTNYGINSVAYDNGYQKGLEKGRQDGRDRDSYDPVRYKEYRNADNGYNSRYGSKDQYKVAYRDGFEAGYSQAYRANGGRMPYPR